MVRVLVVDDFNRIHEAVVRGRSQSQAPIRIIAQAHCGRTAIVLAQVYHYDVVVLPAILSDLDSLEVLKQIKARSASVGALVYGADSPRTALAAYRAGADGYFPTTENRRSWRWPSRTSQRGNLIFPMGYSRALRMEPVDGRVKRCRIVKARLRLWTEGVKSGDGNLLCPAHLSGPSERVAVHDGIGSHSLTPTPVFQPPALLVVTAPSGWSDGAWISWCAPQSPTPSAGR